MADLCINVHWHDKTPHSSIMVPRRDNTASFGGSTIVPRADDGHPIIENYVLVRHAARHLRSDVTTACAGNIIAIIVRPASLFLSPIIKHAHTLADDCWR